MKAAFQKFLSNNRAMVIFLFAVPASFLFQCLQNLGNWFYRTFRNTAKLHDAEVERIQAIVREGFNSGKQMCTARKPWKTMSIRTAEFKSELFQVPINLRNILALDTEKQTIKVEPMATMGDLTHYLIPKGYALKVQVEMDDLTVGGLCMGVGIETSSHREGFLFETIVAYELITADGTLLHVTKESHPALFHALPWSHGTLGFLVAVELEVERVQSHVKLNYLPFHDLEEFAQQFRALAEANQPVHFLEGLVFSESTGVILVGEYAQPKGAERRQINPINRWYKPWFYSHAARFLETGNAYEYIPLRQYFHRHTPSVFFQLKDLIPFANKAWYRYLFAWLGAPKIKLMKYSMTPTLRKKAFENRVAQDIIVPAASFKAGLDLITSEFEIFPLWICPLKVFDHQPYEGFIGNPPNRIPGKDYGIFIDVGIYGIPARVPKGTWNVIESSRKLEAFNRKNEGFQMLYADIFMNRAEFEMMFEHHLYRQVRKEYKADQAFPEVYDKIIPEKWLINLEEIAAAEARTAKLVK